MTTKQAMIAMRDSTQDPELRKLLRAAIDEIETLENKLREIAVLAKNITRTVKE